MDNTNETIYWEDVDIELYHKYYDPDGLKDLLNFEDDNIG